MMMSLEPVEPISRPMTTCLLSLGIDLSFFAFTFITSERYPDKGGVFSQEMVFEKVLKFLDDFKMKPF